MKRIFTLLICAALIINLSVPLSFAEENASLDESISFELIEALGIDEGINKDGTANITRAEFAAMLVRAINMDEYSNIDGSFEDVSKDHPFASEIYTARNLKMTNGTAPGIFSPDDSVNRDVALKMALVAMGYETMAITYGGYPIGYNILEAKLGIMQGITSVDAITVNDAKELVTNCLKEDMATFAGIENGDVIYSSQAGVNLLTERFNFKKVSGVVTKAGYISIDSDFSNENVITISGNTYQSLVPCEKYFGMQVDAWIGNADNRVYALEDPSLSKTVIFDADMIDSHTANKLKVFDSQKTRTYTTSKGLSFIENGRIKSYSDSDFVFSDGTLKLIDSQNDGTFDYAVAEKKQYFVVSAINSVNEIIYDSNSPLGFVELEDDADYVRVIEAADGSRLGFDALKTDMVLEVIQSYDKKVTKLVVSESKKIDGVVEEVGQEAVVIDSTEYMLNTYFEDTGVILVPGTSYTFYIAGDGSLTLAKRAKAAGTDYGFYLGLGRGTGMDPVSQIKILTPSNTVEIFELSEKLTLDGTSMKNDDLRIDNKLVNGSFYNYMLIRYTLNDSGKVTMLDTCDSGVNTSWDVDENPDYNNSLTKYLDYTAIEYRAGALYANPAFSLRNATIFVAPSELRTNSAASHTDEEFEVTNTGFFSDKGDYYIDAYDFDENYYPRAIVVYANTAGGAPSADSNSHLVYSVTDAVNDDGEITKLIRSYSKGLYYQYYVDLESSEKVTLPNPGDIVRYSLNFKNYIVNVDIDGKYNRDSKKIELGSNVYVNDFVGIAAGITGKVKSIGNNSMALNVDASPANNFGFSNTSNLSILSLGNVSYAVFDTANGTVTRGTEADVLTEKMVGATSSSYVFCKLKYSSVTDVIIYK